ncbi:SRPBCC domain-containing protein [Streptomyces sp. SMS_SU21]|uniref:SRPBCC domain-containing protein n=1 Tax=Streptomyces sp. SMS_SU21 TaxID=2069440 RepID=UPI0015E7F7A5|nr:SRPBCC domain-containing protein [Streptomyces sp. SMS_SU21]MCA2199593.1 carbon monoxide dehydrogenase [Streptomyces sp. SMS_SU21]
MEHEVFVPVEAQRLREVLDDPARVARAVPGLQHDAGAEPVTGRLKVRIGGSSITYRGSVRVSGQDDGVYAVEGEASESRGDGTVRLSLRLTPRPADAGTALVVTGTATADGRVTDLPQEAVTSAVTRLLNRFAENLAAAAEEKAVPPGSPEQVAAGDAEEAVPPESPEQLAAGDAEEAVPPESPEQLAAGDFEPGATTDFETTPDAEDTPPPPPQQPSDAAPDEQSGPATAPEPPSPSDAGPEPASPSDAGPEPASPSDAGPEPASPSDAGPEPASPSDAGPVPSTPEPLDADLSDDIDGRPLPGDDEDDSLAEAAHARRTMIGRSAEEVDHAPPRGRYAPVPAPQTVASSAPLRWAAPAAALAVASAVVAIRALRRRR